MAVFVTVPSRMLSIHRPTGSFLHMGSVSLHGSPSWAVWPYQGPSTPPSSVSPPVSKALRLLLLLPRAANDQNLHLFQVRGPGMLSLWLLIAGWVLAVPTYRTPCLPL